jgi:hypothetical protein
MNNPAVLKHDNVAFFDVDDTLIIYNIPVERAHETMNICIPDRELFSVDCVPHWEHIERLKQHKAWGNGVVVWSRSGYEWAEAVVKAFKLEEYVDLICAKPMYYYDDKSCCKILGEHRYIEPR